MGTNTQDESPLQIALEGIWQALDVIAARINTDSVVARRPYELTPPRIAAELGHRDRGARVRRFLREPDDGGPAFVHRSNAHWNLDSDEVARVRRRFA